MFPVLFIILSVVGANDCDVCRLPDGSCTTLAETGVLCSQCNYLGYIDESGNCACLSRLYEPDQQCRPAANASPAGNRTLSIRFGSSQCTCNYAWTTGYFATPNDASPVAYINTLEEKSYIYGRPNPGVCTICAKDYLGPKPNTVTYSAIYSGVTACNVVGGPDPNLFPITESPALERRLEDEFLRTYGEHRRLEDPLSPGWSPCSGHGRWLTDLHYCVADSGWTLRVIGEAPDGDGDVFTPDICSPVWGPPTPQQQYSIAEFSPAAYCSVPWTPTPETGVLAECSGHGTYIMGECVCEGNWTLAEYSLREWVWEGVDGQVELVDRVFTVLTCIACANPRYLPFLGCGNTEVPTMQPTENPTHNPTVNPTGNPTKNPTKDPTMNPTGNPTHAPTKNPSKDPTRNPSKSPTQNPSKNPTINPTTRNPSKNPTLNPTTRNPSKNPTLNPTRNPTYSPTLNPTTRNPSKNPTLNPTTQNPSKNPTLNPTRNPTYSPTRNPSRSPTQNPSYSPTRNPTLSPTTRSPTLSPTLNPTANPTTKTPTVNPTNNPTKNPTQNPTYNPTLSPVIILYVGDGSTYCRHPRTLTVYADTVALCNNSATTRSLNCQFGAQPVMNYTGYPIEEIPLRGGVSPYSQVIGPTGILISHAWNTMFTPFTPLVTSLFDADVTSGSSCGLIPTGVGSPEATCDQWSPTAAPTTRVWSLDDSTTGSGWLTYPNLATSARCGQSSGVLCACLGTISYSAYPTLTPTTFTPTKNPTKNPATLTPTKNPTLNPTLHPTKNPTLNPTTLTPTLNPTTGTPTKNPTLNPTLNPTTGTPTKNPTLNPTTGTPTANPTIAPFGNGIFYGNSNKAAEYGYGVLLRSDMTMLVSGYACDTSTNCGDWWSTLGVTATAGFSSTFGDTGRMSVRPYAPGGGSSYQIRESSVSGRYLQFGRIFEGDSRNAFCRFLSDGTLDTTYSGNYNVPSPTPGPVAGCSILRVSPSTDPTSLSNRYSDALVDGTFIYLAGETCDGTFRALIAKYTESTGAITGAPTFTPTGYINQVFSGADHSRAYGIAKQPTHAPNSPSQPWYVAAGTASKTAVAPTWNRFGVLRVTDTGTVQTDTTIAFPPTPTITPNGNDEASAVEVDSSSRVYVAGSTQANTGEYRFGIVRLTTAMAVDTTYGTSGYVYTSITTSVAAASQTAVVRAAAFDSADRLVVGGYALVNSYGSNVQVPVVARYTTAGALDATFGPDGTGFYILPVGTGTGNTLVNLNGITIRDIDGKIVASGQSSISGTNVAFVAQLTSGGLLDGSPTATPSFARSSTQSVAVPSSFGSTSLSGPYGQPIALQTDGRVLVKAYATYTPAPGVRGLLYRLRSNGEIDPDFGSSGVFSPITGNPSASYIMQASGVYTITSGANAGKIIVSGVAPTLSPAATIYMARVTTAGVIDTSFDTDGIATAALGPSGYGRKKNGTHFVMSKDMSAATSQQPVLCSMDNGACSSYPAISSFTSVTISNIPIGVNSAGNRVATSQPTSSPTSASNVFQVGMWNNDAPDLSFGTSGRAQITVPPTVTVVQAVRGSVSIDTSDRAIICHTALCSSLTCVVCLRLTTAGVADGAYGTSGFVSTNIGSLNLVGATGELQSTQKLVVCGAVYAMSAASGYNNYCFRLTTAGVLDTTFGSNGIEYWSGGVSTTLQLESGSTQMGVVVDASDSIYVAYSASSGAIGVTKLTSDGSVATGPEYCNALRQGSQALFTPDGPFYASNTGTQVVTTGGSIGHWVDRRRNEGFKNTTAFLPTLVSSALNGYSAVQLLNPTPTPQPTCSPTGGCNVNMATAQFLKQSASSITGSTSTLVFVSKIGPTWRQRGPGFNNGGQALYGYFANSEDRMFYNGFVGPSSGGNLPTPTPTIYRIYQASDSGTTGRLLRGPNQLATATVGTFNLQALSLTCQPLPANGDCSDITYTEFLIYDVQLAYRDAFGINTCLAEKYKVLN